MIRIAIGIGGLALLLAGCDRAPDNRVIAAVEAKQIADAAEAGRVPCALAGEAEFRLNCTMERIAGGDGETLVLGRADSGYRRFRIVSDGRGLVAADGAEPARVSIVAEGVIEVTVGEDRYRLPALLR